MFRATHTEDGFPFTWESYAWRPSIFMPRWASRITLEIEAVRVDRLQNITEADAWAEGVAMSGVCYGKKILPSTATGIERYAALWDSINGEGAWDKNPWVWVVEFKQAAAFGANNGTT